MRVDPKRDRAFTTRLLPRLRFVRRALTVTSLSGIAFLAIANIPTLQRQLWSRSLDAASADSAGDASLTAARSLEAKIQVLLDSKAPASSGLDPIVVTDQEANAYLKYHGREFLPPGVYNPEVHIGAGLVSGAADVDFNELNNAGPKTDDWGARVLAMVLRGKQRVSAKGKLDSGNGQGKVTVQDVAIGTTPVPDWLVSLLLQYYVEKRYNIDLSKPLVLPDHVTNIELGSSRATLYRSPSKTK